MKRMLAVFVILCPSFLRASDGELTGVEKIRRDYEQTEKSHMCAAKTLRNNLGHEPACDCFASHNCLSAPVKCFQYSGACMLATTDSCGHGCEVGCSSVLVYMAKKFSSCMGGFVKWGGRTATLPCCCGCYASTSHRLFPDKELWRMHRHARRCSAKELEEIRGDSGVGDESEGSVVKHEVIINVKKGEESLEDTQL